jgi:4-hydroxy-2-oxoheptanedioate aldolase
VSTHRSSRLLRALSAIEAPYLGGWCHLPGSFSAEIIASAGFDWCCVDRQHGMIDEGSLFDMVRVLDLAGTPPLVRVSSSDPYEIGRALDAGARGVIVPVIRSVAEAERAASACRFASEGIRSWATTRLKLRQAVPDPLAVNDSTVCLVMIETREGLRDVSAIAELPGVDGLFVGPADLRLELDLDAEGLREACRAVVEACRANGKVAAVFAGGSEHVQDWFAQGFELIAIDSDSVLLLAAARDAVAAARSAIAPATQASSAADDSQVASLKPGGGP